MCVVTEELSRGYIGVGSLGTRNEIAGELIRLGGTPAQKEKYLPRLASGEILPTAVFTEPGTGSDLGSLRTRAVKRRRRLPRHRQQDLDHPRRAQRPHDAAGAHRSRQPEDYRGLSMLLAEKPRGTEADPFPAPGMTGGEIKVLGYRGMKEYELAFDGFEVPAREPAGRRRGPGLQAADGDVRIGAHPDRRARGRRGAARWSWAWATRSSGCSSARRSLQFPRVAVKLAMMAAETMIARQLTWFAAREKDRAALRHRGRHGQAAGRARRLGQRRQRAADPRRQRLRRGVPHLACSATPASSTSSRARRRSRRRSSRADC
jgi:(2S)-methylsuccinyl-CoA dehydrogenase